MVELVIELCRRCESSVMREKLTSSQGRDCTGVAPSRGKPGEDLQVASMRENTWITRSELDSVNPCVRYSSLSLLHLFRKDSIVSLPVGAS